MPLLKTLAKYSRTVALVGAIIAGVLFPGAAPLSFLIRYCVIAMLFFSFLGVPISLRSIKSSMLAVSAANLIIPTVAFFGLLPFNRTLAVTAFMVGITPSATASPVITGYLGGRVEYATTVMFLTNAVIVLVIPFAIPLVAHMQVKISVFEVIGSVLITVVLPFVLSRLAMLLPPRMLTPLTKMKGISFAIWVFAIFLIISKATSFIRSNASGSLLMIVAIAAVTMVLCVVNFAVGGVIGGKTYRIEAGQALGQKNTTLTLWLALTFISPLVAMGPAFYVIYHNLWNSFQLYRARRSQ